MPLDNIYVLDHVQSFNGEPIHNIWTFNRLNDGTATNLITAFREDIYPAIHAVQCAQIRTEYIKAYSLGDPLDLDEYTMNTVGAITGADMLPVFNAVNFSLKPAGRTVRPGSKRFTGIPESVVTDGMITDAAYITGLNGIHTALGNYISDNDEDFWQVVIVKRVKYNPDPEKPDHFAYRFPETDGELVFAALRNNVLNLKVSHQVSRGN